MSSLRTWMLLSTALVLGCPPAAPVEDDAGPRPDGGVAFDGGVPGPTPDAGPPGLSLAEACSTVVRTRCESLARCGALGGLTTRRCEDILTLSWCGGPSAAARAKAGFLRYDAARAQACVRGLQASTCEGLEAVPSECTRFILPARTLGESCRDGLDECREGVCRGESCPRQCLSPAVEGETCRLDSDCQRGLICRLTDVVGVGRCGRPGTTGDVCNPQLPCEKSMGCSAQGACQPWPAAGERCPDGVCNDAALCLEGTDGLLRCVAKGRLGAPCSRRDGPGSCASSAPTASGPMCAGWAGTAGRRAARCCRRVPARRRGTARPSTGAPPDGATRGRCWARPARRATSAWRGCAGRRATGAPPASPGW